MKPVFFEGATVGIGVRTWNCCGPIKVFGPALIGNQPCQRATPRPQIAADGALRQKCMRYGSTFIRTLTVRLGLLVWLPIKNTPSLTVAVLVVVILSPANPSA